MLHYRYIVLIDSFFRVEGASEPSLLLMIVIYLLVLG